MNFGDLSANVSSLGDSLLQTLRGDLLAHLTDPEQIDLASRATATIAAAPLGMIGATDDAKATLQNDYDAAVAVLASLASAQVEDVATTAADVRTKVYAVAADFLSVAIKAGVASLVAL